MTINQRNSHIRGPINYISNTNSPENSFNELRKTIVDIAENLSIWGEHYPVRWINLERALNEKRIEEQVLSLKNVMDLAENCSVPISDKNEVILFLKYQHEIGNLIFYNDSNLKDCVILNPSWLVDAFKCIICATEFQQFSDNTHSDELLILDQKGEISFDLCQKLFRKKSTEHAKHSELVLQVMEKFDIIVKDKSINYKFICPGGIKKKGGSTDITTFKDICKEHLIDTNTLSPWLCMVFDFLPPALYNHLLVLCMCDSKFEKINLYPRIGIFRILDGEERDQLVICELTKKIIIQRVHPGSEHYNSSGQKNETIPNGQDVFNNISSKINDILAKYKMSLKCTYHIKCGVAPDDIPDYLYSEEYIKNNPERWCNHHNASHTLGNLLKFWLDRSVSTLFV
ncbi:unnamed protein product [Mytilus coruscus]|uniref:COR domain-containing protein n=1 Tax=Mytilus coruscus TaxID=42192 RepID=A0A6J8C080_MYTCO|nr:unnamed protein product [Mytilus coruscus]